MKTKYYIDFSQDLGYERFKKIYSYCFASGLLIFVLYLCLDMKDPIIPVWMLLFLLAVLATIFVVIGYYENTVIWTKKSCGERADLYWQDAFYAEAEIQYFKQLRDLKDLDYSHLPDTITKNLELIHMIEMGKSRNRIIEVDRLKSHARLWLHLADCKLGVRIWRLLTWSYPRLVTNGKYKEI